MVHSNTTYKIDYSLKLMVSLVDDYHRKKLSITKKVSNLVNTFHIELIAFESLIPQS